MAEINVPGATQSPPVYVQVLRLLDRNKAYAAFLAPVIVALATAVGSWVVTGEFSTNEIRIAAGGAIAAAISGVATYLQPTKAAVAKVPIDREAYPPGGGPSNNGHRKIHRYGRCLWCGQEVTDRHNRFKDPDDPKAPWEHLRCRIRVEIARQNPGWELPGDVGVIRLFDPPGPGET